jgi:hypothetical protein
VVTTTAAPALAAPEVLRAGQVPRELLARPGQQVLRAQQAMAEPVEPEVGARVARLAPQARRVQQAQPVRQAQRVAPMAARPTRGLTRQTHPELHHVK